jgi:hypothetical protein
LWRAGFRIATLHAEAVKQSQASEQCDNHQPGKPHPPGQFALDIGQIAFYFSIAGLVSGHVVSLVVCFVNGGT